MAEKICGKCGREMQRGFVADDSYTRTEVSSWLPGSPTTSFWHGTKAPDQNRVPIGAFRCMSCGFLEMYAASEYASG